MITARLSCQVDPCLFMDILLMHPSLYPIPCVVIAAVSPMLRVQIVLVVAVVLMLLVLTILAALFMGPMPLALTVLVAGTLSSKLMVQTAPIAIGNFMPI